MAGFVVAGNPVPKERPRMFRGHAITPKRTRDYERSVADAARTAGITPMDGPVRIVLWFHRANACRCDLDNLIKAVQDGLNGVAYNDDSQIVRIEAEKAIDRTHPRAVVEIHAMPEV